jgi:Xaa-Pro aminopeptidase
MPHAVQDPKLVEAFRQKKAQALPLLNNPLLLMRIKWDSASLRMFTLDALMTRHTALLLNPDGSTHIICQAIEDAGFRPLSELAELHIFTTTDDFYNVLTSLYPKGTTLLAEFSDEFFTLDRLPRHAHQRLLQHFNLTSADEILLQLRSVKTAAEFDFMRRAINATYRIFSALEAQVKTGAKETDLYHFIAHQSADAKMVFPENFIPIISSGPRSQDPHPINYTERKLKKGDYLIVDMGLSCRGYASDITRTFVVEGDAGKDKRNGYNTALVKALLAQPVGGLTPQELAEKIAQVAIDGGFHHLEKHSYGHGLGIEVHDPYPTISTQVAPLCDKPLQVGNVFTFEPGFYDEQGGFRIEDDYFVDDDGYAKLLR